ncbi:hypothetical protein TIFTF001_004389 [Ficus carica]|uniref:Uncharacterized protein n=1 Tax=Ficus carica TaxID=3494 RepID=A0AA87ZV29_FICCA|nr:hypothetical protein TIFTF001_004389 [Ficus carica]
MQQQMGQLGEEMKKMEEQLYVAERERDKALDELRKMKKLVENETNTRHHEESSAHTELNSVKVLLHKANEELRIKEELIESFKLQLVKEKGLEIKLAEKEASLEKLKSELAIAKSSEAQTMALFTENERRVHELEAEMEKGKESGTKMFDSLIIKIKTLEETQMSLEESKLEIASLREKVKVLEGQSGKNGREQVVLENNGPVREVMESLKSELCFAKDNLDGAKEVGKLDALKAESLVAELDLLRNELKLATEAEETSKKALDDLALALKEVATEASQVKEELGLAKAELEHSKGEEERLKTMLESNEERYKRVLEEAWKEAEMYKSTAERLRHEAEETLLAWSDKETGLVECLRRADEERSSAQQENSRLLDLINVAENKTWVSKEENSKLRDILKHALNEANTAKGAAEIARVENSQLKDSLAENEEALTFLERENENYRLNEAAALENIKELKRLLYEVEKERTNSNELKMHNSVDKDQKEAKKIGKTLGLNLKDLKIPNKSEVEDEECEIDEALRGSIFDVAADSPEAFNHRREKSSTFSSNEDGEHAKLEDFGGLDGTHFDDLDNDRNSRKKKALLRRFGDLLIRKKGFYKKELSESSAQQENSRLLDLINVAENKTWVSKEENSKLRDILKHALNEANTTKGAAEIAKVENSQLKDSLAEKEEALTFLARENENYRLNEAAALENIKELKRLLYEVEKERTNSKELKMHNSVDKDQKGGKEDWKSFELESQRSKNTKQE